MNKKTLVISIDALISDDIPLLETLPNLGPIVKGAAQVRDIECIYPTLTYPCHVSIMTGCYPNKHGIVHNERLQVNVPKPPVELVVQGYPGQDDAGLRESGRTEHRYSDLAGHGRFRCRLQHCGNLGADD